MELPLSACGYKKFVIDVLGDHVSTCTAHSGAKKAHDWEVDQIADFFHTTHKVKTQQVVRLRLQFLPLEDEQVETHEPLVTVGQPVSVLNKEVERKRLQSEHKGTQMDHDRHDPHHLCFHCFSHLTTRVFLK